MVIRVSEIPEEGLRFEGPEAFPEPFQDRTWRLEDLELAGEVCTMDRGGMGTAGVLALPRVL